MGLFDSYFDPQTYSGESGGLLGRLLLQYPEQSHYQPGAGFDQTSSAQQTALPSAVTPSGGQAVSLPQTPDSGQTQNISIGSYLMPQFGRADIPPSTQQPPDLGDRLSAGFQSWAHTPTGNPIMALANGVAGMNSGQRVVSGDGVPQTPSSTLDLGDRLSAGFQNWLHTPVGNPMAAIANGIIGLGSGQRVSDPGIAPQTLQARSEPGKSTSDNQDASSAVGNPQMAQMPAAPKPDGLPVAFRKPLRRLVGKRI